MSAEVILLFCGAWSTDTLSVTLLIYKSLTSLAATVCAAHIMSTHSAFSRYMRSFCLLNMIIIKCFIISLTQKRLLLNFSLPKALHNNRSCTVSIRWIPPTFANWIYRFGQLFISINSYRQYSQIVLKRYIFHKPGR